MKALKIIGIIFLVLQLLSLIGMLAGGAPLFNGSIPNLIGKFFLGIIGGILLLVYYSQSE
jgi:hypothetical protein